MARKYDQEYKVQAVKLAKEIGGTKAAKELGIPEGTIHTWLKAVRNGKLDIGDGSHTPALFSPPAVGSQQKPENDVSGFENRGRQDYRKNRILLPNAWYQPTRLL